MVIALLLLLLFLLLLRSQVVPQKRREKKKSLRRFVPKLLCRGLKHFPEPDPEIPRPEPEPDSDYAACRDCFLINGFSLLFRAKREKEQERVLSDIQGIGRCRRFVAHEYLLATFVFFYFCRGVVHIYKSGELEFMQDVNQQLLLLPLWPSPFSCLRPWKMWPGNV